MLFAHGKRRQATPYRGGTNAQTALPLPYTETRLVEEIPTTAQVKHTSVMGARWVNQASLGFARLSVPIFNATIDGRYPVAGRPHAACPPARPTARFPKISFAGPNAPTQWRGTDARAFTEYLNNFTLQNNLQWTAGRHAFTFGFQAQRMDANERERTYGSLATFGFSNNQTAGFNAAGTLLTRHRQRLRQLPARRAERDQRHRGLGGGDERPLLHLRLLGPGRLSRSRRSWRSTSGCATTSCSRTPRSTTAGRS